MIAPAGRRGRDVLHRARPRTSADPGRTWYPTLGKTRFPLWGEVSICYHEGVPGHHLQIAQVRYLADTLSRYQRTLAGTSGPRRGLGALRRAAHGRARLPRRSRRTSSGMLARAGDARGARRRRHRHAPRARRSRPASAYHPGETLDARARAPVRDRAQQVPDRLHGAARSTATSGWPGQAISYKVGERVWLDARDDARGTPAATRSISRSSTATRSTSGRMGLDQLDAELARL